MQEAEKLAEILMNSKKTVFFGGAGVSTESNIPDFRGDNGLYSRTHYGYPPEEILSHTFFMKHPEVFYAFYFDKVVYTDAKPNKAHIALASLEKAGKLSSVITQNIDGLHQMAGSKNVIELHGSIHRNFCMSCKEGYGLDYMTKFQKSIPKCEKCGATVKPDVVLYEEGLDDGNINYALMEIQSADTLIIGGTSLAVYPAAGLIQYFMGTNLVLINKTQTKQDNEADLVIRSSIGDVLEEATGYCLKNM